MSKKNNCYAVAPIATARSLIAPSNIRKPRGAYQPIRDDEFDKRNPRSHSRKKRKYPRPNGEWRNHAVLKRHRSGHGYRMAARSVAKELGKYAVAAELSALRAEVADLQELVCELNEQLTEEYDHVHYLKRQCDKFYSALADSRAALATQTSLMKAREAERDYWALRATTAEDALS